MICFNTNLDRERVVVLGSGEFSYYFCPSHVLCLTFTAGWAGYTLARDLDPKKYQVVRCITSLLLCIHSSSSLDLNRQRSSSAQLLSPFALVALM